MHLYGVAGAGGFAREVMPVAKDMLDRRLGPGGFELVFVVEPGTGGPINGHRVMTEDEFLNAPQPRHFNVAIADHHLRRRIAQRLTEGGAKAFAISAHNSLDLANNEFGVGAILCPFVTVTANARIGRFFHANIYSYVAHDCVIGDFVTFAPDVHCNGHVVIEDEAYIGTGAIIKHGRPDKPLVIGRGAVIGMGAVVTKDVPSFTTVVGNPAVPLLRKPTL